MMIFTSLDSVVSKVTFSTSLAGLGDMLKLSSISSEFANLEKTPNVWILEYSD
jgi:hypothetical protein